MILNGIDLDGLAHDAKEINFPKVVPGRTVHIDADFLAYQTSYERLEEEPKSLDDIKHNAEVATELLRQMAGADQVFLHTTPGVSDKGGRYDIARLKPYQGNRVDKPKPRYLNIIRQWLTERYPGKAWHNQEADDGMSQAQYAAIAEGNSNLSIIASKDKDLNMVPGLHLNWDTGEIVDTDTYGSVWLDESKSTKKIKGYGQAFFWAQMLTGDPADNISGLPKLPGSVANKVKPTAAITKAYEVLDDPLALPHKKLKAAETINTRPAILCGPVTAMAVLDKLTNNKQAFNALKAMFCLYGKEEGFMDYNGNPLAWNTAFTTEAQLLWMRRTQDKNDVFHWFREILS